MKKIEVTYIPQEDEFVVITPSLFDDGKVHLVHKPF